MKRIKLIILCALFLLSAANIVALEEIRIRIENGVKIIENPKKPVSIEGVPTKLILKEELCIGEGKNETDIFSDISSCTVDDEGNIYILDSKEHHVKVFTQEGKYLRTIGRQGQGPGEFHNPGNIQITPKNELLVEDTQNKRLGFFTLDGKFIKNLSLKKRMGLSFILVDSKANFIGREIVQKKIKLYWEIWKYDNQFNEMFLIDSVDFLNPMEIKVNPFSFLIFYEIGRDDNIYYGNPERYRILVFSPEGQLIKRILKEYEPVRITKEDIEEFKKSLQLMGMNMKGRFKFPKFFPAYQDVSIDEQGRIFIKTFEKGNKEQEYIFDIFDAEGKYFLSFPHRFEPIIWKNGMVYSKEETSEGIEIIKRYNVLWGK